MSVLAIYFCIIKFVGFFSNFLQALRLEFLKGEEKMLNEFEVSGFAFTVEIVLPCMFLKMGLWQS